MNCSVKDFKAGLKAGNIKSVYVFCGEEGYLREYWLSELQKNVIGNNMPEFNLTVIPELREFETLSDAVESYPAMHDKRLVIVRDFDIFSANAGFSEKLCGLLEDMPDYCVLVFVYSNIEYKVDKRKKIAKAIEQTATVINFSRAARTDLIAWVQRRFSANSKNIDGKTADFLIFYCGELMNELIPEIEKVSAYAKKKEVTRADIEAVATRNLDAAVFDASNAIAEKRYADALLIAEDLEAQNEDAIPVLALTAQQFRRLYASKLICERGGGVSDIVKLFSMKSDYPAKCAMRSAQKATKKELRRAMTLAKCADAKLKLGAGWEEIKQLIATIAAGDEE